jgi:dolichol kinase
MGFPSPSEEEQEEYRRKTAELEAKIEALKLEICRKKEAAIALVSIAFTALCASMASDVADSATSWNP